MLIIGLILLSVCAVFGAKAIPSISIPRALPIYRLPSAEKQIAFTFDTSYGDKTKDLICVLKKYDVPATFFVTGDFVDRHPQSVKDISTAGFDVMNHSNTHPHVTRLNALQIREEILECNRKIKELTGKSPTLFRLPFGDFDDHVIYTVQELGMTAVQWDVDSCDWRGLSCEQIKKRVLENTRAGSIVLFSCGFDSTVEAVSQLIPELIAKGYEFTDLRQLT